MTWEQSYRLRLMIRTSLVVWATVALLAALACVPIMRWFDRELAWAVFQFTPDGARAILGVLVGSMLTFIVFVLSATLIVVQLASGQLTPRVIALVLSTPGVKLSLMALTFTYTYTLAALGRVEDRVPELTVATAIFLNLACIIVFFLFVQRLSTGLRPGSLMLLIGERAQRVIEEVYPLNFDPQQPEQSTAALLPNQSSQVVEYLGRPGVIMAFSARSLAALASEADAIVELVPQVGDSIADGDALFRVFGGKPIPAESLRASIAVGTERTLEQDPRFAFRILVDIANKALSPAINDPTTAVLVLDQIDHLLLCLGRSRLDEGITRDASGKVRVVYGTPDWPDYVTLAISEIRQYGDSSLQVVRRLRAMLEHLVASLPEARHPPLREEGTLLNNAIERRFPEGIDRSRAKVADSQGVGGSQ